MTNLTSIKWHKWNIYKKWLDKVSLKKTWLLLQFCDERTYASSSEEVAKRILKAITSEDSKLRYAADDDDDDDDDANAASWYYI